MIIQEMVGKGLYFKCSSLMKLVLFIFKGIKDDSGGKL